MNKDTKPEAVYTRQQVIKMTGIKGHRLSYWDKVGIIKPLKIGNEKKPRVLYTWEQLFELKIADKLRDSLPVKQIQIIINYFRDNNYESNLFRRNFYFDGIKVIRNQRELDIVNKEIENGKEIKIRKFNLKSCLADILEEHFKIVKPKYIKAPEVKLKIILNKDKR